MPKEKCLEKIAFVIFFISILTFEITHAMKRNSTSSQKFSKVLQSLRLVNGRYTNAVTSFALLMQRNDYFEYSFAAPATLIGPQCFVTDNYDVTDDNDNGPPTLESNYFGVLIARPNCDTQYHVEKIYLDNVNYYNSTTYANDISIIKTKIPVHFGTECKGPPVEPAWVSCNPDGPPAGFSKCFLASYGNIQPAQFNSFTDKLPNVVRIKIISQSDCEAQKDATGSDVPFNPKDQVCGQTPEGEDPYCLDDESAVLFCEYWNNPSNNGGWSKGNRVSASPPGNGWGWNGKKTFVAVGHYVNAYRSSWDCQPATGASVFIKYGSTTYRDLFRNCDLQCSDTLHTGYRCKGNPPKSLGPVYCIPEPIPHSNGWSSA